MKPLDANGDDITATDAGTDPMDWLVFWLDAASGEGERMHRKMIDELLDMLQNRADWKEGFLKP